MNTTEFIMKDLSTGNIGRYQFGYDNDDELKKAINLDMLLTVNEMAICVINEFTQQDIDDFLALSEKELIQFHHTIIGKDIRSAFGLWIEGNPNVTNHADDTSMEVLELIHQKLTSWFTISGSQVMEFI